MLNLKIKIKKYLAFILFRHVILNTKYEGNPRILLSAIQTKHEEKKDNNKQLLVDLAPKGNRTDFRYI